MVLAGGGLAAALPLTGRAQQLAGQGEDAHHYADSRDEAECRLHAYMEAFKTSMEFSVSRRDWSRNAIRHSPHKSS